MADALNIKNLDKVTEINPGDFLLVEIPAGSRIVDFKNFIIGKDNITFATELSAFSRDITGLLSRTNTLTSALFAGNQDLLVNSLSTSTWLSAGNGIVINNISLIDQNGFATFKSHVSAMGVVYVSGGNSDQWSGAFVSLQPNSAAWNSTNTSVYSNSSRWESDFVTTNAQSADWESVYTTVNADSATWGGSANSKWTDAGATTYLTATTDNVAIGQAAAPTSAKLSIAGHVSATGMFIGSGGQSDEWSSAFSTVYTNSAAWAGAAAGGWTDDGAVVRLTTATDKVGIGTTAPAVALSVAGSISARDDLYVGDSSINFASGVKLTSGNVTDLKSTSGNWDQAYSSRSDVALASGGWDSTKTTVDAGATGWDATKTTVDAKTSNWNTAHTDSQLTKADMTNVITTSGSWDKTSNSMTTDVRQSSAKWWSAHNTLTATSATWSGESNQISLIATSSGRWNTLHGTVTSSSTNWDAGYNDKINSAAFATGTGIITLTQQDAGTVTVDIDGRYPDGSGSANTLARWTDTDSVGDSVVYQVSNKIGIGVAAPPEKLSIAGHISAHGDLFLSGGSILTDSKLHTVKTSVTAGSAQWWTAYSTVSANSAQWGLDTADLGNLIAISGRWNTTHTTVTAKSANWDQAYSSISEVALASSNWDTSYSVLTANSATWALNVADLANVITASGAWNSTNATVYANSAAWSNTDKLQTVYTTVSANSATWSAGGAGSFNTTELVAASSRWNTTHTTVTAKSANWDQAYSSTAFLATNSGAWIDGSGTANYIPAFSDSDTIANSVLYVDGSNVGLGVTTTTTGKLHSSISSSTVYGLVVNQSGTADVVQFHDDGTAVMVVQDGGNVGIGTTAPGEKLTVAGHISATGMYITSGGQSNEWGSTYTTVNANSATWSAGGTGTFNTTELVAASSRWNTSHTSLTSSSANWNTAYTDSQLNKADIANVISTSANWNTAYTDSQLNKADIANVAGVSANWNNTQTTLRANSGDWDNTQTTVNTNSAAWSASSGSGTVNTGTDGKIAFYDGTGTAVNDCVDIWHREDFSGSGALGIGNNLSSDSSVGAHLHVKIAKSGDFARCLIEDSHSSGAGAYVQTRSKDTGDAMFAMAVNCTGANGEWYNMGVNESAGTLRFATGHQSGNPQVDSNIVMSMTQAGNVGIGTDSPTSILHVEASAPTITLKSTGGANYIDFYNTTDLLSRITNNVTESKWSRERASSSDDPNIALLETGVVELNAGLQEGVIVQRESSGSVDLVIKSSGGGGFDPGIKFSGPSTPARIYIDNDAGKEPLIFERTNGGSIYQHGMVDNGNFAVGHINPSELLHVKGPSANIRLEGSPSSNVQFQLYDGGASVGTLESDTGDGSLRLKGGSIRSLQLAANNQDEHIYIDTDGNVGINVDSVIGNSNTSGTIKYRFHVKGDDVADAAYGAIALIETLKTPQHLTGGGATLNFRDATTGTSQTDKVGIGCFGKALTLATGNTTRNVITPSGNFKIGCNSVNAMDSETQSTQLEIYSGYGVPVKINNVLYSGGTCYMELSSKSTTSNTPYPVSFGERSDNMELWPGSTGSGIYTNAGVTIGYSSAAVSYRVAVNGTIASYGHTTVSNGTFSDEKLKENIKPVSYGLSTIMQLSAVEFTWINNVDRVLLPGSRTRGDDETLVPELTDCSWKDHNGDDRAQIGFIAQDVEGILPEIVNHESVKDPDVISQFFDDDDHCPSFKSIDYARLVPVLVEAIKELKREVDDLRAQVDGD